MRRIFTITVTLIFTFCTLSFAQTEIIKQDFSSLEGVIIMPVAGEYLIDLDISSGVHEGDIFTLIEEGQKVIHPETKEVLGTLDRPVGYLQVTRAKSGYSYTKLIQATTPPVKGTKVKRFEQVPAILDATVPQSIKNQLLSALPQLSWGTDNPILHFSYIDNNIVIKDENDLTIKQYQFSQDSSDPVVAAPSIPATTAAKHDPFSIKSENESSSVLNSTVNGMLGSIGLGGGDSRLNAPGIIYSGDQNSDVWTSTPFDGKPTAITVGDFDHDNQQEIALVADNTIHIVRILAGQIDELTIIKVNAATTILGLDSIDLTGDSTPEIIVNSINDAKKLNTQILHFENEKFIRFGTKFPWFLRAMATSDHGQELYGQQIGSLEQPFSGPISRMEWSENQLKQGMPLNLPAGTPIFALSPFTASDDTSLFAAISSQDNLEVMSSPTGKALWSSGDDFGGSETGFKTLSGNSNELDRAYWVQPKIGQLSANTILVPQNDGSRFLEHYRNYNPSRIIAFNWDGTTLKEQWHTIDQKAYLADLTVADADNDGKKELITLVRFKGGNIISKSESHLVLYQLSKN